MSLCTSITARKDSRKVDGRISECPLCLTSSPFGVVEDQSGKFAMMIEFVAIGIGLAMLSLDDHSRGRLSVPGGVAGRPK